MVLDGVYCDGGLDMAGLAGLDTGLYNGWTGYPGCWNDKSDCIDEY